MKQYTAEMIKNIALAGHAGSGKTSLAEAMLFKAGATDRLGKTAEANTVCDFDPEEAKRKVSVSTAVAPLEWKATKINLLDTPGLFDFAGGQCEGICAAESVVIAVSGKSGVTPGVEIAYRNAVKQGKATAFFISKLDTENADFYKVFEELKAQFGPSVCPLVVPRYEDGKLDCYIDLIDMKAYKYDKSGKSLAVGMPNLGHREEGLIAAISEAVAETDEELFEKYFSGEQFTHEELENGIHKGIKDGSISPVFCGSSFTLEGIDIFLDGIVSLLPAANEAPAVAATGADGEPAEVACSAADKLVAFVFKTVADPFVGKLSFLKVIAGVLKADMQPVNARTGQPERMGKLVYLRGKKQEDAQEVPAGDIAAVTKISAVTGDTLCAPDRILAIEPPVFPKPTLAMAISVTAKGDESKIAQGLHRLIEEDPTLSFEQNSETHEQILSGLGEQHLDVAMSKLKNKFGVEAALRAPKIAYRETIRKKVKAEGKYKKQTGGHGQYGHVWIEFEPCDGDDLVFEEKVVGGVVPKGFFPAVEKGLRDSVLKGVLAKYPVVGLKATLVDGSYHPVDSSEMSFKTAASLAYKNGLAQASPVLLEPVGTLTVLIPDAYTGDIMGEINKRRGRVIGMNPLEDGMQEVAAEVPMSEMQDFTTYLRSTTQGRGNFTFVFARYEQLPPQLEAKVIEEAQANE